MAQKYKSKKRSAKLDQFYTVSEIAKQMIGYVFNIVPKENRLLIVEPSAGNGSFSDLLIDEHHCKCFDLDPKKKYIMKRDFLNVSIDDLDGYKKDEICVIGNPPFGKNSSLAVKFFNHCATMSSTICLIVPKTFNKQSIKNRLNLYFHLTKSIDLPKNSFIFDGEPYDVPCVFQIWQHSKSKRRVVKSKNECKWFEFVKKGDADFAIRRAGGRAGTAFLGYKCLSEQSNHFCKIIGRRSAKTLVEMVNSIDFDKWATSTVGVKSISKGEIIRAIEGKFK